ncbi:hypothetical protein [Gordonia sihwensis]
MATIGRLAAATILVAATALVAGCSTAGPGPVPMRSVLGPAERVLNVLA